MENPSKLESVVEWMRLHGVKGYTELPSGGFSLELFEDQVSPQVTNIGANPYDDPDMFPDGVVPRFKRLKPAVEE